MSYTYSLTSSQIPPLVAPSSFAIGNGATGLYATGAPVQAAYLNQGDATTKFLSGVGVGGYGIVSGLDISSPSGLNIVLSAGIALLDRPTEFVASSPTGHQVLLPTGYTLANNATNYVWLTTGGGIVASTTMSATPGLLFIGTVTTAAGVVTVIDYSGRVSVSGPDFVRTTADKFAPVDAPPAGVRVRTLTASGQYFFDGTSHKALVDPAKQMYRPYLAATLAADYVIGVTSPNLLVLNPGGSARNVTLPDPTTVTPGHYWVVQNPSGATGNLTLKNFAGSAISTITPGQSAMVSVSVSSSGVNAYPSAVTASTAGTL